MRTEITKDWKDVIRNAEVKVFFDDGTGMLELEDQDGELIEAIYDDGNYRKLQDKVRAAIEVL
ncbi:hypothetical protein OBO34_07050 [Clostridiales Family XIII bacterium ASD5510]|uniref:Uncharacterized protein n=1 Tax=Hominibacterium faecale TaxID=2839743 RepID=A0A9J6QVH9_9FIRM|nr:hypothetical protein [Hominibacterium faecale]MCU7378110.1 hypothetical protein [Hominibacterium faecale]